MSPSSSNTNELLTPTSLALSLAPPRAPPHETPHRHLLTGLDPASAGLSHSYYADHSVRSRLSSLLPKTHIRLPRRLPHPHLPAGPELGDRITRALGSMLTLETQNALRDGGGFRSIVDGMVTMSAGPMALSNPGAARRFVQLSTKHMEVIKYGTHEMQKIELLMPHNNQSSTAADKTTSEGLLFFVHGGAWGSGMPWMYRLVASSFLDVGMAVAVVGYRTYPDADVPGQVDDLERAARALFRKKRELFCQEDKNGKGKSGSQRSNVCLMGHSSGAHIALMMLMGRIRTYLHNAGHHDRGSRVKHDNCFDFGFSSYVGLSGPYDIGQHFDYEAGRGVEELSPMKAACGSTRQSFRKLSPAHCLLSLLGIPIGKEAVDESVTAAIIDQNFPPSLLLCGIEDSTVPFTATSEAARILRSCGVSNCEEVYLGGTGHQETVMELMLGGPTRDTVIDWLLKSDTDSRSVMVERSRL